MKSLEYAGNKWNVYYLKTITEEEAIKKLIHKYDRATISKIWKIANGKSKPNYIAEEDKPKPKRKRVKKESKES